MNDALLNQSKLVLTDFEFQLLHIHAENFSPRPRVVIICDSNEFSVLRWH
jgi:hypothetical protein